MSTNIKSIDSITHSFFKQLDKKQIYSDEYAKFNIILPKEFGFCGGVVSALKKLEDVVSRNNGEKIFLLGEIIHNPVVNDYFRKLGVVIIHHNSLDTVFELASSEDTIVIPAFGIPISLELKITSHFKNIVDTTCWNVKSVWKFVEDEALNGSTILLYGKYSHPEVEATLSRAGKSSVIVLPSVDSVKNFLKIIKDFSNKTDLESQMSVSNIHFLNFQNFNISRIALANQTTMLYDETLEIEDLLSSAFENSGTKFISCRTICKATYNRQKAALEVCRQNPDLIFVVGGYDSSNTIHLYRLASKHAKTYYIKDDTVLSHDSILHFVEEENKLCTTSTCEVFHNVKKIAIFAGASCPHTVIEDVIKKINTLEVD